MISLYIEGFFPSTIYTGCVCSSKEQEIIDKDRKIEGCIDQIYTILTPEIQTNKRKFYRKPTLDNANKMDLEALNKVLKLHTQLKQRLLELFPNAIFEEDGEQEIKGFIEMCQDVKNGKPIESL